MFEKHEFNLQMSNFEGPMDLLLDLVKEKKVDIFEVNLLELATSYLSMIENMKDKNIDVASEYLVMAAMLLQLKTRSILDNPEEREAVEEDKSKFLAQLIKYQQYKKIGSTLREQEQSRKKIYIKHREDFDKWQPEIDHSKIDGKSSPDKLMQAMRKMFERTYAQTMRETTIEKFNLSPADRRLELLEILKTTDTPTFEQFFNVPSMNHFVITMLTILDMSRKQEIILEQDSQFDEIRIKKGVIDE